MGRGFTLRLSFESSIHSDSVKGADRLVCLSDQGPAFRL